LLQGVECRERSQFYNKNAALAERGGILAGLILFCKVCNFNAGLIRATGRFSGKVVERGAYQDQVLPIDTLRRLLDQLKQTALRLGRVIERAA
jgi:hypothetical protein